MKLGLLTPPEYMGCAGAQAVYNDTWGHFAPVKNVSYKGVVRYTYTDHSQYGIQAIILEYNFPNLSGPYIHDILFGDACSDNWKTEENGVFEREITFRNYRFYYGKPKLVLKSIYNAHQI